MGSQAMHGLERLLLEHVVASAEPGNPDSVSWLPWSMILTQKFPPKTNEFVPFLKGRLKKWEIHRTQPLIFRGYVSIPGSTLGLSKRFIQEILEEHLHLV